MCFSTFVPMLVNCIISLLYLTHVAKQPCFHGFNEDKVPVFFVQDHNVFVAFAQHKGEFSNVIHVHDILNVIWTQWL